jgi:hypothetical protein
MAPNTRSRTITCAELQLVVPYVSKCGNCQSPVKSERLAFQGCLSAWLTYWRNSTVLILAETKQNMFFNGERRALMGI